MEVPKELRADIERTQNKLKIAIRNHQMLVLKLKADPDNVTIKYDLKSAQNDVISIGLEQRELIERLRKEIRIHQKNVKANVTKNALEERTRSITNILNKSRKQSLVRPASLSSYSTSEDSLDVPCAPSSPHKPLLPHELTQIDFLGRVGLCTHEVFKELQNKRVERKRRSTANPHFLYGNRWDQTNKRKKNSYLVSSVSPPNTRQAVKNKMKAEQRGLSPPNNSDSRSSSPVNKKNVPVGLNIPNLPSGLTIERINGNKTLPDNKVCVVCRTAGVLTSCESCGGNFHVSCHNRPLVQQPRHCPKCLGKKDTASRDVGSLTVPPSMTVLTTYVSAEVKEKEQERDELLEKNKSMKAELSRLEERAGQLSDALKSQADAKEQLLSAQRLANANIQRVLDFVNIIKGAEPARSPPRPADGGS